MLLIAMASGRNPEIERSHISCRPYQSHTQPFIFLMCPTQCVTLNYKILCVTLKKSANMAQTTSSCSSWEPGFSLPRTLVPCSENFRATVEQSLPGTFDPWNRNFRSWEKGLGSEKSIIPFHHLI